MRKKLKDLFTINGYDVNVKDKDYKFIQVNYENKLLGYGIFLVNNFVYKLTTLHYEDFTKYFGISKKELLDIIVEYVTNKYGDNIDLTFWEKHNQL